MSLTGFQRYRRLQQIEEMRPENINKIQDEEAKEKIGNEPTMEEAQEIEKLTGEVQAIEEPTEKVEEKAAETKPRRGRRQ